MKTQFRRLPVWLAALPLLICACLPLNRSTAVLPTSAPTARLPLSQERANAQSSVPPTWTPPPIPTSEPGQEAHQLPTADISGPTPTIPTSTPVPPTATRVPVPVESATPTRYISYIPDLPPSSDLGPSKLGIHVLHNNDPAIMDFIRRSQPVVVKAIGDFGFLAEARAASTRTTIIGRVDDIFVQNYLGDPEEAAQDYVNKHLSTYQANPYVDYWEGWNEPDPPNADLMMWYTRFEQERVRQMASHGLRSAIGGFPPGVPEVHEFALFVPAIETAIEYRGILTLHEGDLGSGDLTYLYGSPLPGYPAYPDRGSGAFRYRWFYREILEPAGLVIPLVISELDFAGWDHTSEQELINQLVWYDVGVRQDGYVIGFTVFTAGAGGFSSIWDINHILPSLADYVISQR
jgi:hypothetical protein